MAMPAGEQALSLSIAIPFKMQRIRRQMASIGDLRRQVDQVDRQVVELLARRNILVKQVMAQLPDEAPDKEREAQVLSNWLEEGFDYSLDEAGLERVCKAVMDLGRKAKDS